MGQNNSTIIISDNNYNPLEYIERISDDAIIFQDYGIIEPPCINENNGIYNLSGNTCIGSTCSTITISDGKSYNIVEYVEKINDDYVIHNPAGETVILQDYNSQTPSPTPPYTAENVANKRCDLLNANNTTYPTTLAVLNAILNITGTTLIYLTGVTNIGTGVGIYSSTIKNNAQLKSLIGVGGTVITYDANNIYISGGSGGSGGGVSVATFNTYTGTTAPNTYEKISIFNLYTGTTAPTKYETISNFNTYTGTTAPNKYETITNFNAYTGTTAPNKYETISNFNKYTGDTIYSSTQPASVTVGGIAAGTILTGKTANQLLEEILVPTLYPTFTSPSESISLNPSTAIYEIGAVINTLCVTGSLNRGTISPAYGTDGYRSGTATCYCYTGSQISGAYSCTSSSLTKCALSYAVSSGSQTWSVFTCYSAGCQPKDSKGNNYDSICGPGQTSPVSATITGILPWYWGKKKVTNVINSSDVATGTKTVACANGTLSITYNSASDDYLWFAVPQGTPAKTSWFVCSSNQGCIGGTNNLFASSCTVSVTSSQGCWSGCNYMVYVSCVTTGTATGVPMCML